MRNHIAAGTIVVALIAACTSPPASDTTGEANARIEESVGTAVADAGADSGTVAIDGIVGQEPSVSASSSSDSTGRIENAGGSSSIDGETSTRFLVMGSFDDGRLYSTRVQDLRPGQFEIAGQSPEVGSTIEVLALQDGSTLTVATDHRQLVKLTPDWSEATTFDLPAPLLSGFIGFGSLHELESNTIVASYDDDGTAGVARVELNSGRGDSVSIPSHTAAFPESCVQDDVVYVAGGTAVSAVRVSDLEVLRTVDFGQSVLGAICTDAAVYTTLADEPRAAALSPATLERLPSLDKVWTGEGGSSWTASTGSDSFVIVDPLIGSLISCSGEGSECGATKAFGTGGLNSPTILDEGRVAIVDLDLNMLFVIDLNSLEILVEAPTPPTPRGLAVISVG